MAWTKGTITVGGEEIDTVSNDEFDNGKPYTIDELNAAIIRVNADIAMEQQYLDFFDTVTGQYTFQIAVDNAKKSELEAAINEYNS